MSQINQLCVERTATVRDAMRNIDESTKKIAFVVDKGKLVATVTDGDIRRYLLSGHSLQDPVMNCANCTPHTASSRSQAKEMMERFQLNCVPVMRRDGQIRELVFRDLTTVEHPNMALPVVIMAGGKGTRLEPFTKVLPKPLVPVGDQPILEHIMKQFSLYGCNSFHLIVNHKKQLIKAFFAECESDYDVHFYDETIPLGTGGGLYMLRNVIDQTFFLTNCDILIDADYEDIHHFHKESGNVVTMVCAYKNIQIPYGVIEMGVNGTIEAMREKPELSFLTNTGMYLVEPCVLEDIPENTPISFPDIVELQRKKGRNVSVYPINESEWMDMGQLEEYRKMCQRLEAQK